MPPIVYSRELQKLFVRRPALKRRIERVAGGYFPEIARARFGRSSRRAYYDFRSGTVRVNSGCSAYVIGHELMHLLQDPRRFGSEHLPTGERSCDLFLFARSPDLVADLWDGDASYLIRGKDAARLKAHFPRAEGQLMVHEVCSEAVRLRAAGKRDYIRWAERQIGARIGVRARARAEAPTRRPGCR